MNFKESFLDFINYAFFLFLISFSVFFFISGHNFYDFLALLKMLAPLAIFVSLFLIKIKLDHKEFKKRSEDNNLDIILNLTYWGKIKVDILLFLAPIIILAAPFLNGLPDMIDLAQGLVAFFAVYLLKRLLFKNEG